MSALVIGFLGKAGSGKTTAANYVIEHHGAKRASFAAPLKEMAREIWDFRGEQVFGDATKKEETDPRWGISPRQALQALGEAARRWIGPSVWINACFEDIKKRMFEGERLFVIDDVRYRNEVEALNETRLFRTFIIRLTCTDSVSEDDGIHPSEAEVDLVGEKEIDCHIVSHRTPGSVDLLQKVNEALLRVI